MFGNCCLSFGCRENREDGLRFGEIDGYYDKFAALDFSEFSAFPMAISGNNNAWIFGFTFSLDFGKHELYLVEGMVLFLL